MPSTETLGQQRLKLLSYNVQVGIPTQKYRHYVTHSWKHILPFPQRRQNLDSIAEFIAGFDIVGLQELDAGSIRSEFIHQPEYLARKAGFPYCFHRVNRDLGVLAQHSLAFFSRIEPIAINEHRLPSTIPGRGALEVHFGDRQDPLVVLLTHLSLSARARKRQLQYISQTIRQHRHVVLMGDFNAEIHSSEMAELFESTNLSRPARVAHTYPSWRPRLGFDHIFVTPEIKIAESEVFGVRHSDHLPIGIEVGVPRHMRLTPAA